MFLQYYLTEGASQNLLIDTINEKLYYLPKALNSVEEVVHGYTDYQLADFEPFSMDRYHNQWLEILEIELNLDHLQSVFRLADNSLADHLLFWVLDPGDLALAVAEIQQKRKQGDLSLRQICFACDFDLEEQHIPYDPSGFIAVLRATSIHKARAIGLQNFVASQQAVIQSESSHLFYDKRLYIDARGFIKAHAESNLRKFHVAEYADQHKILVSQEELTSRWKVTKAQIQGCRACEYRNICIDSDPLVQREDGTFQRSSPCAYDPKKGEWQAKQDPITPQKAWS